MVLGVVAEKGFCMLGDLCPYDHGMDPVVVEDIGIPNVLPFPPVPPGNQAYILAGAVIFLGDGSNNFLTGLGLVKLTSSSNIKFSRKKLSYQI